MAAAVTGSGCAVLVGAGVRGFQCSQREHGRFVDEIGAELCLSPATARTHVSHAMATLGRGTARSWS
ncbi:hypothetical protein GCM10009535_32900 [Streptomyces thermocarboxydovorans]|uniref:HTH luxR-type domain-containing protein n=1 Tax=Streptomyces thermocarboxydovorans TaxID=59298 RepID=A0ABN1HII8_9ACTN